MTKVNDKNTAVKAEKEQTRTRAVDLTLCGFFAALIAVGAFIKIEIPVEPYAMHFTLQWFFVLIAGLLLGKKRAAMSVCVYLIIGLVGVPVFASGGGPAYLLRPTFGFLLGFALAAFVMGMMMEKKTKASYFWMLLTSAIGLTAYYGVGILYFYFISNYVIHMPVGWKLVLINCCLLTIVEDALLCVLAVTVCNRLRFIFQKLILDS
ncbi:MAG: biotin transporter BioY [Eubacteriales bacterium]|nr:biotin transporter BioY [Eubacteriales bacterium]